MLGNICRDFRVAHRLKLKQIEGGDMIKTLSGFECGRSNNSEHFIKYVDFAIKHGLYDDLVSRIANAVSNMGVDNGNR